MAALQGEVEEEMLKGIAEEEAPDSPDGKVPDSAAGEGEKGSVASRSGHEEPGLAADADPSL